MLSYLTVMTLRDLALVLDWSFSASFNAASISFASLPPLATPVFRYLTNEGIQYLRDFLHLPPEIVPATLKRATRPEPRPREGGPSDKPRAPRGPPGAGGERDQYR